MPTHSTPPIELRQFNTEIQFLLKPRNPHARSLLAFIRRSLRQFHLDSHFSEVDIFISAYLRGVKYVTHKGSIDRPKAWMRSTAYNIIRELNRELYRLQIVAYDDFTENDMGRSEVVSMQAAATVTNDTIDEDMQAVMTAYQSLSVNDQRIIQLRVVQGLSWHDVGQALCLMGEPQRSNPALRKRGQRALENLRRNYHKIRPAQESDST